MKGDGIQHAITDQFGIWDTHGIESSFGSLWDLIMATDLVMNMEIDGDCTFIGWFILKRTPYKLIQRDKIM